MLVAFPVRDEVTSKSRAFGRANSVIDVRNPVFKAQDTQHPFTTNCLWIKDYLQYQHDRNCLNIYHDCPLQVDDW